MTHMKTAAGKRSYVKKHLHALKGADLDRAYRATEKGCMKKKK